MSDKQRAEFEGWVKTNTTFKNPVWLESHQEYDYTSTNMMWKVWQAAIASVVVDLKSLPSASYVSSGTVYLTDVIDAIENAGASHNE